MIDARQWSVLGETERGASWAAIDVGGIDLHRDGPVDRLNRHHQTVPSGGHADQSSASTEERAADHLDPVADVEVRVGLGVERPRQHHTHRVDLQLSFRFMGGDLFQHRAFSKARKVFRSEENCRRAHHSIPLFGLILPAGTQQYERSTRK